MTDCQSQKQCHYELSQALFQCYPSEGSATPVIAYPGLAHSAEVSTPDNAELLLLS